MHIKVGEVIMSNTYYGFLLTIIAGLSTMLGIVIIFFKFKNTNNIINFSLSFAASVMLSISIIELIPDSINMLLVKFNLFPSIIITLIFFAIGIILSLLLDELIPVNNNDNLYKIGLFSLISIILHNIPEGIITFMTTHENLHLGIIIACSIILHNIPEGISIAIPIYYSSNRKIKAIFYTFVAALSEPIGAVLAYLFLKPYMREFTFGILFSIVAGIMSYIACYELQKEAFKYNNYKLTIKAYILGILIVVISHIYL